jgi:plexin A
VFEAFSLRNPVVKPSTPIIPMGKNVISPMTGDNVKLNYTVLYTVLLWENPCTMTVSNVQLFCEIPPTSLAGTK